jgi:hypothetical protein
MRADLCMRAVVIPLVIACLPVNAFVEIDALVSENGELRSIGTYSIYDGPGWDLKEEGFELCTNELQRTVFAEVSADGRPLVSIISPEGATSIMSLVEMYDDIYVFRAIIDRDAQEGPYNVQASLGIQTISARINVTRPVCLADTTNLNLVQYSLVDYSSVPVGIEYLLLSAITHNATVRAVKHFAVEPSLEGQSIGWTVSLEMAPALVNLLIAGEIRLFVSGPDDDAVAAGTVAYELNSSTWLPRTTNLDDINKYFWIADKTPTSYTLMKGATPIVPGCTESWICSEWSLCSDSYVQVRQCRDEYKCGTVFDRPTIARACMIPWHRVDQRKQDAPNESTAIPQPNISKKALFDIDAEIVSTKGTIVARISLTNFGDPGLTPVKLTYTIADNDNVFLDETEEMVVETQTEFLKTLHPGVLDPGDYTLRVALSYPGQNEPAESVRDFIVPEPARSHLMALLCIILVLLLLGQIVLQRKKALV